MHRGAILASQGSVSQGAILGLDNIGWSDVMYMFLFFQFWTTHPSKYVNLIFEPTYFIFIKYFIIFQGIFLGQSIQQSANDCSRLCYEEARCNFASFDADIKMCLIFSTCPTIDESQTEFKSSEKDCYKPGTIRIIS